MSNQKLLIDLAGSISLNLWESTEKDGYLYAQGEFGRANVPTLNKRIYPSKLWEREIRKIQEAIQAGKVQGELDHPADGKTSLKRVSHLIQGLELRNDGLIVGRAKVLKNDHGNQLRSILEAGGAVGVSSRGMGSTQSNGEGYDVVQEDFGYMTHDFVADPAVSTSYPSFKYEMKWVDPNSIIAEKSEVTSNKLIFDLGKSSIQNKDSEKPAQEAVSTPVAESKENEMTEAEVAKKLEEQKAQLQAEFDKKLEESKKEVEAEKAKLTESVAKDNEKIIAEAVEKKVAEIKSSPELVAGAVVMEDIKKLVKPLISESEADKSKEEAVSALEAKLQESEANIKKLGEVANRLAVKIRYTEILGEAKEEAEELKFFLGEMKKYASVSDLDNALTEAKKVMMKKKIEKKKKEVMAKHKQKQMEAFVQKQTAEKTKLESRVSELEKALKESTEMARKAIIESYASVKLQGNPNAERIKKLCESAATKEQVDEVIKANTFTPNVSEEYNGVRRRLDKYRTTTLVEDNLKKSEKSQEEKKPVLEGVDREIASIISEENLELSKML